LAFEVAVMWENWLFWQWHVVMRKVLGRGRKKLAQPLTSGIVTRDDEVGIAN